jgi:hypothetical protein
MIKTVEKKDWKHFCSVKLVTLNLYNSENGKLANCILCHFMTPCQGNISLRNQELKDGSFDDSRTKTFNVL